MKKENSYYKIINVILTIKMQVNIAISKVIRKRNLDKSGYFSYRYFAKNILPILKKRGIRIGTVIS